MAVENATSQNGNWEGWRTFVVSERRKESEVITSFILRPKDGGPVAPHQPGQYLTFLFPIPDVGETKRTYTISCAPNAEFYRISVKREPLGTASRWLHDKAVEGTEIPVAAPTGDFVLPLAQKRPVVLLSGGVGLTPMLSMFDTIAKSRPELEAHYVHGTIDGTTHAFGPHIRETAAAHANLHAAVFYSDPRPADAEGKAFDQRGFITLDWLRANTPFADADFFVCGPLPFMRAFITGLVDAGVPRERVHYEFFGSVEDLVAAWPEALDFAPADSVSDASPPQWAPNGPAQIAREKIGQTILHSQADAVVVSDREGYIVLWNPGAERIFGFTEAEAVGQSLDLMIPESLRGRHWSGYRETVSTKQSRYGAGDLLSVPAIRKDGSRISVEFTIAMMMDDAGEVEGMVAIMRDITPRFEELKTLRKKLAALEGSAA